MNATKTALVHPQQSCQDLENGVGIIESILDGAQRNIAANLRSTTTTYTSAIEKCKHHLEKSMIISLGVTKLRSMLDDKVMDIFFMPLAGIPIGFKCDKQYPREVVRECLIGALLAGLRPVGNEFNIIAGQLMIVRNGWRRLVLDYPGVVGAEVATGTPSVAQGNMVQIRVKAQATLNNSPFELHDTEGKPGRVFMIRTHASDTIDTWQGKAERRAWKALYELLEGRHSILLPTECDDGAAEETKAPEQPIVSPLSRTQQLAAQLAQREPGSEG